MSIIIPTVLDLIDASLAENAESMALVHREHNLMVSDSNDPKLHFVGCNAFDGSKVMEERVFEGSEFKSFVCGGCGHWSIVG